MKKTIITLAILLTGAGTVPFAADKIVSQKVQDKFEEFKASVITQDPTLTMTNKGVSYDIFSDLITVKNIEYYSVGNGLEISMDEVIFTPVSTESKEDESLLDSIPDSAVTHVKGGKFKVRSSKLDEKGKELYGFFAGSDQFIEFSTSSKGIFSSIKRSYEYKSNLYIENAGTFNLNFNIDGINKDETVTQDKLMEYVMNNILIDNFEFSFSTENTKAIMNDLVGVLDHVKSETQLLDEFEKLASKMEGDDGLKGFAKPIRDVAKSYFSGRKVTLSLEITKPMKPQIVTTMATFASMGQLTPTEIANQLNLQVDSSLD